MFKKLFKGISKEEWNELNTWEKKWRKTEAKIALFTILFAGFIMSIPFLGRTVTETVFLTIAGLFFTGLFGLAIFQLIKSIIIIFFRKL